MKFKYCFILLLLVCFLCGSVYAEDLNHDNLTSHSTLQKDTQVVLDENLESEEISEEVETNPDEVLGVEENEKLCSDEGIIYFDANALKDGNGSIDNPYKEFNSRTAGSIPAGSTIYLANGEYDFSNYANFDNLVIVGESSQNTIVKNIWFGSSKLFGMGSGVGSSLMLCNVTFVNSSFTYYTDISAVDCVFEGYSDLGLIASLNYENDYVSVTLDNCGFVGCECGHDSVISVEGGFLQIKNSYVGSAKNNFIYAAGSTVVLDCVDVKKSIVQGSDNLIQLESCLLNVFNSDFDENNVTGGSLIIIDGNGQLNILNSTFTNNNIDTGVVNSNYAFVNITNSNFKNNHAKRFAGAVFTAQSTLLMENNAFEKNIASWSGGAVIALNTTLQILTCNFTDNSALYSGGALYAMYGNILIEESIFNSNSALNGSAIFIDAVSPMGAGYSLFYGDVFEGKDKYSIYAINDENYDFGNEINPEDVFQTKYPNLVIGDGDYSLVKFTPSFNGTIPAYYDLRQKGYVTPIKNQGPDGNCWAFTGIATLESCILKALGTSYDFSEVNMKNLMAWFSDYGWNALPNSGGTAEMAIAYLTSWLGPVYEEEDPYSPSNSLSEVLHSHFHVQNVLFLDYDDFDSIKKAIIEYGAVGIGMAWNDDFINDAAYYCWNELANPNHAVTIIGWNDTYSRYNFNTDHLPEADGAWIIKNSWGNDTGDEGYFYVSYSDKVFGSFGTIYTFIFNDTIRFDKNYQYDIQGEISNTYYDDQNTSWYKNIFSATDSECLAAVSTYFIEDNTAYTISINVNGQSILNQSGVSKRGYYTINLNKIIPLNEGDIFEVQFKITVDDDYASIPIVGDGMFNKLLSGEGVSFISYNGVDWSDLYDSDNSQVACIKAFTILGKVKTNIALEIEDSQIVAVVTDQYGNIMDGNVEFKINGQPKIIEIADGKAVLSYDFNYYDIYNITASWNKTGYVKSVNSTIFETLWDVDLKVCDVNYNDDLIINITLGGGKLLKNNITIAIDDYNCSVNQDDLIFKVPDTLNAKQWNISISYITENGYKKVMNKSFNINKIESSFTGLKSFNFDYGNDFEILISYFDSYDSSRDYIYLPSNVSVNLLSVNCWGAKNVTVNVVGHDEAVITNKNNVIGISNLSNGEYKLNITTIPNENHIAISQLVNFTVNKVDSALNVSDVVFDYGGVGFVNVEFAGASNVTVSVVNHTEAVIANENNVIGISNLSAGNYILSVTTIPDENHYSVTKNVTVVVKNTNEKVNITIPEIISGKSNTIPISLGADAKGNIAMTIDNNLISVTQLVNGSAIIEIPKLSSGKHLINLTYSGDEKHVNFTQTQTVEVPIYAKITSNDVNCHYDDGALYKVLVVDDGVPLSGVKVTVKVNGKIVAVKATDKNGYATYKITQTPKTYSITAEFNGLKTTNKLNVKHIIKVKKVTKVKKSKTTKIKITLKGKKVYKNKNLIIKFKGKKYNVKTNKKGVGKFKISKKMVKKFKKGKKIKYTVSYKSDKLTRYVKIVK